MLLFFYFGNLIVFLLLCSWCPLVSSPFCLNQANVTYGNEWETMPSSRGRKNTFLKNHILIQVAKTLIFLSGQAPSSLSLPPAAQSCL